CRRAGPAVPASGRSPEFLLSDPFEVVVGEPYRPAQAFVSHQGTIRLSRGRQWTPPRGLPTSLRAHALAIADDDPAGFMAQQPVIREVGDDPVHALAGAAD